MSERSGPDALVFGRAIEAVIWGMPAVNFQLMYNAFAEALGGRFNQVLYWSRLPDWRNQTLTPNPDTVYFMPFFDTSDGPVVLDIPAANGGSITGSVMDAWQCALEDVGPSGADVGAGGRYLILPPDHAEVPPGGYIVLRCSTFRGYALCRSNVTSGNDDDVGAAVEYGRRIGLYPLDDGEQNASTVFVDAAGVLFDSVIPYDARFFDLLSTFVEAEPWQARDQAMVHQLESVGIVKGRPFAPGDATHAVLTPAAGAAGEFLDDRYTSLFAAPYYPDGTWAIPAAPTVIRGQQNFYADDYPVDDRAVVFSAGFFSAKHLGTGQFYLMAIADAEGQPLRGDTAYRLRVPADPPVTLYWSATVYDRDTHGLIRDVRRASRASNSADLVVDADGSVRLHFGPDLHDDARINGIPTDPGGRFEVLFRFYGPTPGLFDKSWRLPDIERVR